MGWIGGRLGTAVLRRISRGRGSFPRGNPSYERQGKLETLFGPSLWEAVRGKVVIDFGCGEGAQCIELARHGAHKVIGLDIRPSVLDRARDLAEAEGVADRCKFGTATDEKADVILSVDAFEHFEDPAGILSVMDGLIRRDGAVWISFGPTWFHPRGGHLFSVFPWAHLVFSEHALLRWRADFKDDGATRFHEVSGGLNQMTIARFERLVAASPFRFADLHLVPIRAARFLAGARLTRELLTSVVRCRLVPR